MDRVECVKVVDNEKGEIKYFTLDQDPKKDEPVKVEAMKQGHQFEAI